LLNSKHLEKIRKKLAVIQLNNKNNKHSDKLPDVFLCNNIDNYVCQYCFKTLVKSYKKMYTYYSIEDRSEVMKNKKNVIMITMCVLMLLMATGYAYFVTQLNINATGNITSEWNVYFSNITSGTIVGKASNSVTPSVSGTTANIEANLELPGDSITYELTLSNVGTVDAIIDDINVEVTGSSAIIYSMDGIKIGDKLIAKENKTITIKIEYDSNVTSQPIDTTKSLKVSISCVKDMGQIIDSVLPNMSQPIRLSTKILKDNIAYEYSNIADALNFKLYENERTIFDKNNEINLLKDKVSRLNNETNSLNDKITNLNTDNSKLKQKEEKLDSTQKQYMRLQAKLDTLEYYIDLIKDETENNYFETQYQKNNTFIRKLLNPFSYVYLILKSSHKELSINFKLYRAIKNTKSFDIGFYLKNNKDIQNSKWCKYFSPQLHYVCSGFKEKRQFSKKHFNTNSKEGLLEDILNSQ